MMKNKFLVFALFLCCAFANSMAKNQSSVPGGFKLDISKYEFIDSSVNIIQFPGGTENFEKLFLKLDTLVFENHGKIRILHIGGSHIQADIISGRIREHFVKEYPGASAGRGFIFPYAAAKTNTPSSYASHYKGIWHSSKNIQKHINHPLGLMGIAISTTDPRAEFSILLDRYNSSPIWGETKFRLFGYSDNNDVVPVLKVGKEEIMGIPDPESKSFIFESPRPIDTINIKFKWLDTLKQATLAKFVADSIMQDSVQKANTDSSKKDMGAKPSVEPQGAAPLDSMFYGDCDLTDTLCMSESIETERPQKASRPRFTLTGILAENDAPGIIYTSVGINGARVKHYLEQNCSLFEKELEFFKPDLVIFAIGINDAHVDVFNDTQFRTDYENLMQRFRNVNPDVAFIFETNNDSFRKVKKRYVENNNGEIARKSFFMLAEKFKAGVWDKYSIMGGLGSMALWEKSNLAKSDKVHFRTAGYNLLGDLFYKAFVRAYQEHIAGLPALKPVKNQVTPAKGSNEAPKAAPAPDSPKAEKSPAPKSEKPAAKPAEKVAAPNAAPEQPAVTEQPAEAPAAEPVPEQVPAEPAAEPAPSEPAAVSAPADQASSTPTAPADVQAPAAVSAPAAEAPAPAPAAEPAPAAAPAEPQAPAAAPAAEAPAAPAQAAPASAPAEGNP